MEASPCRASASTEIARGWAEVRESQRSGGAQKKRHCVGCLHLYVYDLDVQEGVFRVIVGMMATTSTAEIVVQTRAVCADIAGVSCE